MLRAAFAAFLIMAAFAVSAQQSSWQQFRQLPGPDKRWVIAHPFIAKKAAAVSQQVQSTAKAMQADTLLDGDANGGQVDAFRHALWMATLTNQLRWRAAWKLGKAHERSNVRQFKAKELEDGSLPDRISGEMDAFNNRVGIQLGKENVAASFKELCQVVAAATLDGQLLVIRKNAAGQSLDCDGHVIPKSEWEGTWENNRCLVPSN